MSQPEHVEMLVLGSGEGGKFLAWHMAKSGHRTAVVERKLIGGSFPNTHCLPNKNEILGAKDADQTEIGRTHGELQSRPYLLFRPLLVKKKKCTLPDNDQNQQLHCVT